MDLIQNNTEYSTSISIRCLVFLSIVLIGVSCGKYDRFEIVETDGLTPVYLSPNDFRVSSAEPKEFDDLGKIVVTDSILLINERFEGIHVVDNSDPGNPVNIAFWDIPGNIDFTVTGNILYADNSLDLYTIDISDIHDIKMIARTENIYQTPQSEQFYPSDYEGYFECVDAEKGIVIDWIDKFLVDPKCRTFR